MQLNFSSNHLNKNSLGSKIIGSFFLSIFAAAGTFFTVMLIRDLIRGKAEGYMAFFLVIPALFMLIGYGGVYSIWFGKANSSKAAMAQKPKKQVLLILFGAAFASMGIGMSYIALIRPLMLTHQATDWVETPCTILSAQVERHRSDDGYTYSIEIDYQYEFNGQTYQSDRYDFVGGSSSGQSSKEKIVRQYQKAKQPVCYVDPDDPASAVLNRKLSSEYAFGLIPLVFAIVGILIMIFGFRYRGKSGRTPWLSESGTEIEDGMRLLKPKTKPVQKFIGLTIGCLFWNGIVVVLYIESAPIIFKVLFTAGGVGWIAAVIYSFLSIFNPKFLIMIQPGNLQPGSVGAVSWKAFGKTDRVEKLTIKLIGREEATYRRGTDTCTDKSIFFETLLADQPDPETIAMGQSDLVIPAETMHSFEADNNKIIWTLKLRARIPRLPDVKYEYPITIHPHGFEQEAAQ